MKSITVLRHIEVVLSERDVRYQQRFDAQSQAIEDALLAAKEAVIKAEVATEKRFESVNEFRQTLTDQAGTFVSRVEFTSLKERMDRSDGKTSGVSSVWGIVLGVSTIISVGIALYAALH